MASSDDMSMYEEYGLKEGDLSSFRIDGDKAYMNGVINSDTERQVQKLIDDYPEVKTIVMETVDGSIDDTTNLKASRLVRNAHLNTYLTKDSSIASGGTDFFLAGENRTVEEGATIGVHSWAGGDVKDASTLSKDDSSHKPYIDYYTEMEMSDPEGFYFFTINAAKADSIHNMTQEEIDKYEFNTKK